MSIVYTTFVLQKYKKVLKHFCNTTTKVICPLLFAAAILWWMYRDVEWNEVKKDLVGEMRWEWMLLSMPFGILAQLFRAFRWKQVLKPLNEHPRLTTCVHAVFLSYASSLIIPRVGEVLRCGIVRRWDDTSLIHSIGTVITERVVDMAVMLLLTFVTVFTQIPVFAHFVSSTGISFMGILHSFTTAGYMVTAVCALLIGVMIVFFCCKMNMFHKTKGTLRNLLDGILSIRMVNNQWLFAFYTLGIWAAYFFHFYLAFFCFPFTQSLDVTAALVAFIVGSFAVLVPTPNGAGPWHFAVKTILVLYGVGATQGAMFVLIVHALQTLLVILLGLYALLALSFSVRHHGSLGE